MTATLGSVRPTGRLTLDFSRGKPTNRELDLDDIRHFGFPHRALTPEVREWRKANRANLARGLRKILLARAFGIPHHYGALWLELHRGDGTTVDYGLASLRVVTTVGAKYICDDLNAGGTDVTTLKFHGFGTGTTAEAVGDTALVTELTTQYATDNTRVTGSQASATVSTNATYTTVATLSPDTGGTIAITEHGIFSASSAGTLLDRSVFSAVNLVAASDSLQATYVFTVSSGS